MITILPSITNLFGNWQSQVNEIDKLHLKSVALFLTMSNTKERKQIYTALEKTKLSTIPFVHARHDMSLAEYKYLIKRWHTEVFNLHSDNNYRIIHNLSSIKKKIFLENNPGKKVNERRVKNFGGWCVDFTHLEADRLERPELWQYNYNLIKKYSRGCGHISAIKPRLTYDTFSKIKRYDHHVLVNLSELDYLKNYSLSIFPRWAAIELDNSLTEQLKMKKHIEAILKDKKKCGKI